MAKKPVKKSTKRAVRESEDLPPPKPIGTVTPRPEIDEDGWDKDGLTLRQRRFVEALVGPAGGNATKAAEMAGYAAENRLSLQATAAENLGKPMVQQAIAHALAAERLTPEWAKRQLADMASASMSNFVTVNAEGKAELDLAKAAAMGAIGQIKEWNEEVIDSPGGGATVLKRKLKLHDRATALGLLLKFHGLVSGDEPEAQELEIRVRPLKGGTVRKPDAESDAG